MSVYLLLLRSSIIASLLVLLGGCESESPEPSGQLPTLRMINELGSADELVRTNALKNLSGNLHGRRFTSRQPDLVAPLTKLFNSSPHPRVRAMCVKALTVFAEDGQAPLPLLDSLSDPEPGVVLTGMFALRYFPNDQAVEPLCQFVQSRQYDLFSDSAVVNLGRIGDSKAVPTLTAVLMDANHDLDQAYLGAAMALARCGPDGFKPLVSALDHEDPRIRRAAVVGLDISGRDEAKVYLDRALNDPDPNVRERAKNRVGKH